MVNSTYRVSLDLRDIHSGIELNVKKNDKSRYVYFIIQEGGVPYELESPCFAKLRAKKPSGTVVTKSCVTDLTNQRISFGHMEDIDDEVGIVQCELLLMDELDEDYITTPRFDIRVDDTIGGEEGGEEDGE